MSADFVAENPNTTVRVVKALIRAARWLDADSNAKRAEAVEILSRPEYVGADPSVIGNSMTGTFEYEKGDKRSAPDFNLFFRHHAHLSLLQRRGVVPHPDAALGPDTGNQVGRVVRGGRAGSLSAGHLRRCGEGARCRRPHERGRTSRISTPKRAFAPQPPISSTESNSTDDIPTLTCRSSPSA